MVDMVSSTSFENALMSFEISGSGNKSPIVLVPGGLSGWISWKLQAEVLSKNHVVIRVQLLCMAAAEKNQLPGEGYSLRSETKALKNTLDKLNIRKVNLVGYAHGGAVSLDFALEYPNLINTLTLIGPSAYWVARAYRKFQEEEQRLARSLKGLHYPVTEDDLIRFVKMNHLVPEGVDPRTVSRWPAWNSLKISLLTLNTAIEHSDDLARLKVLSVIPVLLVKGRDSTGFYSGIAGLLSKSIGPSAKVITLPGGHACHIEAKDQFISALEEFLSEAKEAK